MGAANKLKKDLKPDAIPTIFDFPPHLVKETNPRKVPTKRKATSEVPADVSKKWPRTNFQPISHDHNYCTSPSKVIARMKKSLEDKRKKIKSLMKIGD